VITGDEGAVAGEDMDTDSVKKSDNERPTTSNPGPILALVAGTFIIKRRNDAWTFIREIVGVQTLNFQVDGQHQFPSTSIGRRAGDKPQAGWSRFQTGTAQFGKSPKST